MSTDAAPMMRNDPLTLPAPGGTPLHLCVWRSITPWDWLRIAEMRAEHFAHGGRVPERFTQSFDALLDKLTLELHDARPEFNLSDDSLRDSLRSDLLLRPRYDPAWVTSAYFLIHEFGVSAESIHAAAANLVSSQGRIEPVAVCATLEASRNRKRSSPDFADASLILDNDWMRIALRATVGFAEAMEPGSTHGLSTEWRLAAAGSWVLITVASISTA